MRPYCDDKWALWKHHGELSEISLHYVVHGIFAFFIYIPERVSGLLGGSRFTWLANGFSVHTLNTCILA